MECKAETALRETITQLKNREFKYAAREEKPVDWRAYNQAQLSDLRFFLTQTRRLVDWAAALLPPTPNGVGRPRKEASDVAKAVLLMEYLQVSERAASVWAWVFKEKLGITAELSPRSVGRGFEDKDVQFILNKLFGWTRDAFSEAEETVAIDATGVSESIKKNYESVKSDDVGKAESFLKLSLCAGVECHGVGAFALTRGTGDSPLFESLLAETVSNWRSVGSVCADAGYLSRYNCQTAADAGVTPYIFPKAGITLKQKGSPAWKSMLSSMMRATQAWLATYHLRSESETVNSCLARRFRKLSCRKGETKRFEETTRIILHNLRQLNTALHENKIKTF